MLQKGLNKSSSSPSMQTLGKVNHNFYQQNQGQTPYFYRQNNYTNLNGFNSFIPQTQNLQNQINSINLQMSDSKINSSHTSFMNFTHNPHLVKNNQSYNFSNTANNTMTRNYSNQNGFLSYRNMTPLNPLNQSSDEIRYQQLMNQKRLQEQQRLQLLQRTKMNNINYNNLNNINYTTNNNANRNININYVNANNNNVSRNPNLTYTNDISNE